MTHIEHESAPWTEPVIKEVSLLDSAVHVLKSSLGARWGLKIVLLAIIVLIPGFVLFITHRIEFDPALFVTEWLHLSIEGIFFFFILEIVRHQSLSFSAHQSMVHFVTVNYEKPIARLLESIRVFRHALSENSRIELNKSVNNAWGSWTVVNRGLSDQAIRLLPGTAALEVWSMRNDLRPERCGSLLASILGAKHPRELDQSEYEELLAALERFLKATMRLHTSS
jgi:hypothetical protein